MLLSSKQHLLSSRFMQSESGPGPEINEWYNFRRPPRVSPADVRPARCGFNMPLPFDRGGSDATLAHRMGEGLGVRATGEVSNLTFN
jgi:hypothetical protein